VALNNTNLLELLIAFLHVTVHPSHISWC